MVANIKQDIENPQDFIKLNDVEKSKYVSEIYKDLEAAAGADESLKMLETVLKTRYDFSTFTEDDFASIENMLETYDPKILTPNQGYISDSSPEVQHVIGWMMALVAMCTEEKAKRAVASMTTYSLDNRVSEANQELAKNLISTVAMLDDMGKLYKIETSPIYKEVKALAVLTELSNLLTEYKAFLIPVLDTPFKFKQEKLKKIDALQTIIIESSKDETPTETLKKIHEEFDPKTNNLFKKDSFGEVLLTLFHQIKVALGLSNPTVDFKSRIQQMKEVLPSISVTEPHSAMEVEQESDLESKPKLGS